MIRHATPGGASRNSRSSAPTSSRLAAASALDAVTSSTIEARLPSSDTIKGYRGEKASPDTAFSALSRSISFPRSP